MFKAMGSWTPRGMRGGKALAPRAFQSPGKLPTYPKAFLSCLPRLKMRSQSRRREGAGGPSRLAVPSELPGAARAGRQPGASPQILRGRGPGGGAPGGGASRRKFALGLRSPVLRLRRLRERAACAHGSCPAARGAGLAAALSLAAPAPWAARPPASWTRASAPTSEVRPPTPGPRCPAGDPRRGGGGGGPALPPRSPPARVLPAGSRPPAPAGVGLRRRRLPAGRGFGEAPQRERQVRAAGRGSTPGPRRARRGSVLPPPRPAPRPHTPRPPVPGAALSSELFVNWPQKQERGYPSFLEIPLGIPGL